MELLTTGGALSGCSSDEFEVVRSQSLHPLETRVHEGEKDTQAEASGEKTDKFKNKQG